MILQTAPILVADGFTDSSGNALRDLQFLGPANTEKPVFRLRETLDSEGFQIRMIWQQLSQTWLVRQLLTKSGDKVTCGIPLTGSGVALLAMFPTKTNTPAGQLWYAFDDGRTGKPGRLDWRGTAHLYYRPRDLVDLVAGSDKALL